MLRIIAIACLLAAALYESSARVLADELGADQRWAVDGPGGVPDFTRHVEPLLGKLGCSNRACHGSFQGQNGFRLSLFASDPQRDYEALVKEKRLDAAGTRVDLQHIERSLILQKPSGQLDHGGGDRFAVGGWEYRLLRAWLAAGAPNASAEPSQVLQLEMHPREIVLAPSQASKPVTVVARFADGTREDVTSLTQFSSKDEAVAKVDDTGRVASVGSGDTAVIVTFGGAVDAVQTIVPRADDSAKPFDFPANNPIDELVAAKWRKLGLEPSPLANDAEFLRRASLDLIGTLPTSAEVREFLADDAADKRTCKIEELLARPEYAIWWATLFADLTGCDDRQLPNPRPKPAWLWWDWLHGKLAENLPYDELVAGMLTATSREGRTVHEYVAEHLAIGDALRKGFAPGMYSRRKTNDLFWKSNNGLARKPDELALRASHAFLGVRLECAQCHKHPFDRWTQEDFRRWEAFFSAPKVGIPADKPEGVKPTGRRTLGFPNEIFDYYELWIPRHIDGLAPRVPGGEELTLNDGDDPRIALMQWLRSSGNPYFAKAIVNRLWAHYFGTGIVDPPDDLNAGNPPSNPQLLDWLAADFVAHKFDLQQAHRTILSSRTYQLSWRPTPVNALDTRNFTHAQLRRLPAEVLVDALNQATGTTNHYAKGFAPPGTRAIGLAPARVDGSSLGYVLTVFGRPPRVQNCDCERSMEGTLPQALYLINDAQVNDKIQSSDGRLTALLAEPHTDRELIDELYLATISRLPSADETSRARAYFAGAESRRAAADDLLWALLNLEEFIFNH